MESEELEYGVMYLYNIPAESKSRSLENGAVKRWSNVELLLLLELLCAIEGANCAHRVALLLNMTSYHIKVQYDKEPNTHLQTALYNYQTCVRWLRTYV